MEVSQVQTPQLNSAIKDLTAAIMQLIKVQEELLSATKQQSVQLNNGFGALGQTFNNATSGQATTLASAFTELGTAFSNAIAPVATAIAAIPQTTPAASTSAPAST